MSRATTEGMAQYWAQQKLEVLHSDRRPLPSTTSRRCSTPFHVGEFEEDERTRRAWRMLQEHNQRTQMLNGHQAISAPVDSHSGRFRLHSPSALAREQARMRSTTAAATTGAWREEDADATRYGSATAAEQQRLHALRRQAARRSICSCPTYSTAVAGTTILAPK